MIFESLYIKSFGKLAGYSLRFSEGVNILEGANESGKSTVCAFIRFMFYGLPSKTEEKLHYISWQTAMAGGSLTFREGDARYRIEREVICSTSGDGKTSFRERLAVYDAETNLVKYKNESPGEIFFGVSANTFDSTAYIRQSGETRVGGSALGEEAENILFSGNESINTKKALTKLDGARAFLLHKNRKGGKIAELEAQREEIAVKLEDAKKASGDIIYLEGTHRQLTEKKEDSERRLKDVSAELEEFNRYSVKKACLRSKTEKQRLAETEKKIEALRTSPDHNGHDIATVDFIHLLEEKQSALELATTRYGDAENRLKEADDKLSEMKEKLDIFRSFGANEGKTHREELIARTEDLKKTRSTCRIGMAVTLIAALVFAVLGAMFLFSMPDIPKALSYVCLALAPICLIPCVIFLLNGSKAGHAIGSICAKFGCRNEAEFSELVNKAAKDETYMIFITGNRDEASDKFNAASDRLERVSSDTIKILREYGFTVHENTAVSVSEALELCRETRTEIAKLSASANELRGRIAAIADDLSVYSDDYLREALFKEYDEPAMEVFNLAAKKRDRDFLQGSVNSLTERIHGMELELATLRAGNFKPTELAEQKAVLDDEIEALTKKWAAYMLAIESIEHASGKLREGISPKIAGNAGRLMNAISAGKYDTLGVDLDFSLSFTAEGATHDASYLSAGTGDLAYICLRIALIELLYKKSMPPFIFDESFVRMDDDRLARMIALIHKYGERGCQSIILSCHDRERKLSDRIGSYHHLAI